MSVEDKREIDSKRRGILGKIICILLALVLWGYVAYEKNPKTTKTFKNIKIELTESAALERKNMSALPTEMYVSVKLTGERNVLAKVNKNTLKANINLSDVTEPGEQENPTVSIKGIPSSLGVERIKITSGKLIVEKRETKVLEVYPGDIGKLDASLSKVEDYKIYPAQIEISGPESMMKDIKVVTEAINLNNVRKSEYDEQYKVVLQNSKGEGMDESLFTLSDHTVRVIRTYKKNKTVKLTEPNINGKLPGYNINIESVEPLNVEVSGKVEDVEILESLSLEDIDAYELSGKPSSIAVDLPLPENIESEVSTVIIKLRYTKMEQ